MRSAFLRSLRLLAVRDRVAFLSLTVARAMTNILDVLGLVALGFLGSMLAARLQGNPSPQLLGISLPAGSDQALIQLIILIAVFFIVKSLLSAVLLRATALVLARAEGELTGEISEYLFLGSLNRLKAMSRGDIQFAVTQSSHFAVSRVLAAGAAVATDGTLFLLIAGVFFFVDPTAALIVTAYFVLLVGLFQLVINRRLHRIGESLAASNIGSLNGIQDILSAFRELLVLSRRDYFLGKLLRDRRRYAVDSAEHLFLLGLPRYFVESALMLGVLGLIAWQFARGDFAEGMVVIAIFLAGGVRMMGALLPLQNAVSTLRTIGPQADLALSILERSRKSHEPQLEGSSRTNGEAPTLAVGSKLGAEISLEEVWFTYHDASQPVIRNVSLKIAGGSHVALIGPSGAGKTTIADLMLGVNHPDSGFVLIDGVSPEVLREATPGVVTYVPQTPGMVSGTIRENIALGVPTEEIDDEMVWRALRQAELAEFAKSLPGGLKTDLGKHSDALSGGQKQRIGLARALYNRPRVLILDEATSALDAGTEASISNTIRSLGKEVTVVIIAHRLSTVQTSDRVYVIEGGTVSDEGTFSEVRVRVPMIEKYVRLMGFDRD